MNHYERQIRELRAINAQMTRHRDELASALSYIEGHLELAEEWEPGESELADRNGVTVIRQSLACARTALEGRRTPTGDGGTG